jgi:hypothetical protein
MSVRRSAVYIAECKRQQADELAIKALNIAKCRQLRRRIRSKRELRSKLRRRRRSGMQLRSNLRR